MLIFWLLCTVLVQSYIIW